MAVVKKKQKPPRHASLHACSPTQHLCKGCCAPTQQFISNMIQVATHLGSVEVESLTYSSLAVSGFHLPCLLSNLYGMPAFSATEAPPDLRLCILNCCLS